jgi:hypothetical protein
MLPEDAAGVFLDFAEGDGLETARALQPEAVGADPAEQVEDAKLVHRSPPRNEREEGSRGSQANMSAVAAFRRLRSAIPALRMGMS